MGLYNIMPPFKCQKTIEDLYPGISLVDLFDFHLAGQTLTRQGRTAAQVVCSGQGYRLDWQDQFDETLFTQIAGDLFYEAEDPASEFLKLMKSLDGIKADYDHYRRQGFELLLLVRKKARPDRSENNKSSEKFAVEYLLPVPTLDCLAELLGHEQPDEFIIYDGEASYYQPGRIPINKSYGGYRVS